MPTFLEKGCSEQSNLRWPSIAQLLTARAVFLSAPTRVAAVLAHPIIILIARAMVSEFGDEAGAVLRSRANKHSLAGETEGAELWGLVADTVSRASEYPLELPLRSVQTSETDEEKSIRYRYKAGELRALGTLPGTEKIREALIVVADYYEGLASRLEDLSE